MTKIDMNKQYRTRDGRAVRLLCVDRNHVYPVVALILNDNLDSGPYDNIIALTKDGLTNHGETRSSDLVPVPEYSVIETNPFFFIQNNKRNDVASFNKFTHPNAKAAAEAEAARLNGGEYAE